MKKDETIRGEAILEKLAPELAKIFNSMPRTGAAEIKVIIKDHRIIGTAYKYSAPDRGPGL
jgi:hypothetical protein